MNDDILKVYNKEPEAKIKAKPLNKQECYKSVLAIEVPYKYGPSHPDYDQSKCSWCQENPRIVADPDVITWCERCYILQFKKHDGTFIQHKSIPVYKKLLQDYNEGKIKPEAFTEKAGRRLDTEI